MSEPVWILHDGKAGLRNQAMGVAEALGLPFAEKRVALRLPWRALPLQLWSGASGYHAQKPAGDRIAPPWPEVAIGAGGRGGAMAAAIRAASSGACLAVAIQNPRIPPRRFDLMVVPAHDGLSGPNIFVTAGAVHRVTAAKLAAAAAAWCARVAHVPHPRVAVLIGGGNGSYRLPPPRMHKIAAALRELADRGAGLLVTPSRRTGAEGEAILRKALVGTASAVWDGTGENPYFGYLGLADAVLATADSISMITEASATGKPVHILPLEGGSAKFELFHASMRAAGITRPFEGRLERWTYAPRDDTAEAARRIRDLLAARNLPR